ncbi:MAG: AraC family transcriptional regulator [Bacillota bacterium]|nr:AraC family transcriptional regulator [Bacillota bacterium]
MIRDTTREDLDVEVFYRHHLFHKELAITELISLFYFKSPRNYCFTGETHDFWEFIYIDKGQMLITAGKQQYVLKAGELAFHCPGEFHAVHACGQTPANFVVCAFTSDSEKMQWFTHKILSLDGRAREALQAAVREAGGNLLPDEKQDTVALDKPGMMFGAAQLIQSSLEQVLIMLYRQSHSVRIQQRAESYALLKSNRQLVANIKVYLEEHVHEKLTLTQIARANGYSVAQMKKLFKMETGSSIIDWFIGLKMDEARRMIQEGDLNFSQIAASLGHDNPHYFSRLFRQRNDMTMTEYSRSMIDATRTV